MARKLDEYFSLGVRLVWLVNPMTESTEVYTSRHQSTVLDKSATLEGGVILPVLLCRSAPSFPLLLCRGTMIEGYSYVNHNRSCSRP